MASIQEKKRKRAEWIGYKKILTKTYNLFRCESKKDAFYWKVAIPCLFFFIFVFSIDT